MLKPALTLCAAAALVGLSVLLRDGLILLGGGLIVAVALTDLGSRALSHGRRRILLAPCRGGSSPLLEAWHVR